MSKNLRIAAWNANGLKNRQQDLQLFLDMEKIDICLVSETHFTTKSFIKLRGYQVYYAIYPTNNGRGGSAVLIRKNIAHYDGVKHETEYIQSVSVNVKTKRCIVTIAAIYCPPKCKLNRKDYVLFLQSLGNNFILGGDFNAKNTQWGSRLTDTKGRELYQAAITCSSEFHSTRSPTYWPTNPSKIPDLIDFFLVKNISADYISIKESLDLFSDHSAIILTLGERIKKQPSIVSNELANCKGCKPKLEKGINPKVPLEVINEQYNETVQVVIDILQAVQDNILEVGQEMPRINFPKKLVKLIEERRKARLKWQQTRSLADNKIVNRLTEEVRREIKNDTLNTCFAELSLS